MGIYFKKSIRVGPIRFNLSNGGVGVSAGVKGLRFGTGPRGNYVHMGRGGLYYRATLPSPASQTSPAAQSQPVTSPTPVPAGSHAPLQAIASAQASHLTDSLSRPLLDELNGKARKMRMWPIVASAFVMIVLIGNLAGWVTWLLWTLAIAGVLTTYYVHTRDLLAKTAVLLYELEPELEHIYGQLPKSVVQLGSCSSVWHIAASGKVHDRKYHAGASALVSRKTASVRNAPPPFVQTNINVPSVVLGPRTLYFFPDRVLVYDKSGEGAVRNQDVRTEAANKRFIEEDGVPGDAQVVDHTWRYVNKSGGPDRRFKDNRELPVCLYEEITLHSDSGLKEVLQVSRLGLGHGFVQALAELGKALPAERLVALPAT